MKNHRKTANKNRQSGRVIIYSIWQKKKRKNGLRSKPVPEHPREQARCAGRFPVRQNKKIGSAQHYQYSSIQDQAEKIHTSPQRRTAAWPGGEEREKGRRPSQLWVLPLLANYPLSKSENYNPKKSNHPKFPSLKKVKIIIQKNQITQNFPHFQKVKKS